MPNAFLYHYEKIWPNDFPSQFKPLVYRRYVDNIFILFKSKEHLELFVNYINSKHKDIKFSIQAEDLNNFSFLDVKITRRNKRFVASIFRKATFSRIFTNFDSFIFDTNKIGIKDRYPVNTTDQCINKFLDKLYVPKQTLPTVPKRELLIILPFL